MPRRATTPFVPKRQRPERHVLQITLPLPMLLRIRKLAAADRRTASDYGQILIEDHLRQLRQQSRVKRRPPVVETDAARETV